MTTAANVPSQVAYSRHITRPATEHSAAPCLSFAPQTLEPPVATAAASAIPANADADADQPADDHEAGKPKLNIPPDTRPFLQRLVYPYALKRLLSWAKPYKRDFSFGIIVVMFIDILDVAWPAMLALAVDEIHTAGYLNLDNSRILLFAGAIILITSMQGYFRYHMRMLFVGNSARIARDLRRAFFKHLTRLPPRYYHKQTTGELMSRATNDIDAVRLFIAIGTLLTADTLFYFVFVPIPMMLYSLELTLLCALPLPLIPFLVWRMSRAVHARYEAVQEGFADISSRSHESIAGMRVVKSFVREKHESEGFDKVCLSYRKRFMRMARVDALFAPVFGLFIGIEAFLILYFGGQYVLSGAMSIGAFLAFFTYAIKLTDPMIEIGWTVSLYQRGSASLGRIEDVLNEKPDIESPENPVKPDSVKGDLEIRDLTFHYPGVDEPTLKKISLKIPAGKTVAIMGPVGTGKSTLLALIPRLIDPPPDTVFLDGVDVRQYDLDWLRRQLGYVPQETFLFSESIFENVRLGVADATKEQVIEAATIAQLDKDVRDFPDEYETLLGERGVNLSGGQRQRVAIARAVLRRPPVLLLDDCLSAVDTETEEAILRGLRSVMQNCTALVVSHRVSTVMHADEIVIVKDGEIVERGTHDDLLQSDGFYADLYRRQQTDEAAA